MRRHVYIIFQICDSNIGGCQSLHDGFWKNLTFPTSFPVYCLIPVRIFVSRRQSVVLSNMRTLGSWLKLRESPLEHCRCMCPPLKPLSHFLLNAGFVSFWTNGEWSPFHDIAPDSEVSSSHHLIKMKFNNCLQMLITRFLGSHSFLIIKSQHNLKLNRISFWISNFAKNGGQGISLIVFCAICHPRNFAHRRSETFKEPKMRVLALILELQLHGNIRK